ncbi:MAG TPA: LLM class F420-dependent oxidoreductase [Ktedonobacterales bacterium]|nr:LLM class F420-dependent oxidoreductase [Ktedonobacterales bacterium]
MDLGRVGIWSGQFWGDRAAALKAAAELEQMGYGTLWFPNRRETFVLARELLDATHHVVIAPGIASIWMHPAEQVTRDTHALEQAHPGRFLLGLGVSHQHMVDHNAPGRYDRPVAHMLAYLDELDHAPTPVPPEQRVLAALGPRMLAIARDRSAGAHPYLTTPDHTRRARDILGPGPILAPEQAVVLESDPVAARRIAREHLARYLEAPNYVNNWLRLGFTQEDIEQGGSDRLVDALVAWGSVDAVRERIEEHFRAGASHVCIQVLTAEQAVLPMQQWRALAPTPAS